MNKILLHSLVDAPAPPDWMIQQAIALSPKGENGPKVMNNHGDEWTHRPLYKDGKEYRNSFNWSTRLDEVAVEWAKNNITKIAKDVRSVHTTPDPTFPNGIPNPELDQMVQDTRGQQLLIFWRVKLQE